MTSTKSLFPSALLALAVLGPVAQGAVLASTNFDGRTLTTTSVANDTVTGLSWTLNGLENPGDMAAKNAAGDGLAIFNGNTLMQNAFVPGLNTGNGNTFWTTAVNLTVAAGNTVTLTDVTFDYWAINGSQAQNVTRRSDFTVTLLSPFATPVDSVDIADASNGAVPGSGTALTATFGAPIVLSAPGTYTLQIKGGDFLSLDETGNHTGIDNLSINGNVSAVPEPSAFLLSGFGLVTLLLRRRPSGR